MILANVIYSFIVMAIVIMIVNYDHTVITIINYDPKTFTVEATGLGISANWVSLQAITQ